MLWPFLALLVEGRHSPECSAGLGWPGGIDGNPSSHASTAAAVCESLVSAAAVMGWWAWCSARRRISSSCVSTRCQLLGGGEVGKEGTSVFPGSGSVVLLLPRRLCSGGGIVECAVGGGGVGCSSLVCRPSLAVAVSVGCVRVFAMLCGCCMRLVASFGPPLWSGGGVGVGLLPFVGGGRGWSNPAPIL